MSTTPLVTEQIIRVLSFLGINSPNGNDFDVDVTHHVSFLRNGSNLNALAGAIDTSIIVPLLMAVVSTLLQSGTEFSVV